MEKKIDKDQFVFPQPEYIPDDALNEFVRAYDSGDESIAASDLYTEHFDITTAVPKSCYDADKVIQSAMNYIANRTSAIIIKQAIDETISEEISGTFSASTELAIERFDQIKVDASKSYLNSLGVDSKTITPEVYLESDDEPTNEIFETLALDDICYTGKYSDAPLYIIQKRVRDNSWITSIDMLANPSINKLLYNSAPDDETWDGTDSPEVIMERLSYLRTNNSSVDMEYGCNAQYANSIYTSGDMMFYEVEGVQSDQNLMINFAPSQYACSNMASDMYMYANMSPGSYKLMRNVMEIRRTLYQLKAALMIVRYIKTMKNMNLLNILRSLSPVNAAVISHDINDWTTVVGGIDMDGDHMSGISLNFLRSFQFSNPMLGMIMRMLPTNLTAVYRSQERRQMKRLHLSRRRRNANINSNDSMAETAGIDNAIRAIDSVDMMLGAIASMSMNPTGIANLFNSYRYPGYSYNMGAKSSKKTRIYYQRNYNSIYLPMSRVY